jgi:hypothetical protein
LAKALISFLVRQVVSDVREPRAPRLELLNESKRLVDGLMHRMGNVAQGVENQFIEAFEKRHGRIGKLAEVS